MALTQDEMLREITQDYLHSLNKANPPSPEQIQFDILSETALRFDTRNANAAKGDKWRKPSRLNQAQIADILLYVYPIINLAAAGLNTDQDYDLLAIYQESGENEGIYLTSEREIRKLAKRYCYTLSTRELSDILANLKDNAVRKTRCQKRELVAVNNGIFNYDTKKLQPFNEDIVFIAKSKINYNPNAVNPVIHNQEDNTDWDVESWILELFPDPDMANLIWEILGAIIRPNVSWNKSAWLYSNTGNNGKGTLCELMRQLSGEGSYASIPLSDFSKDFLLEPLTQASAIIVDENDVGTFIDKAANLKAIITNDVFQMNRKFKTPIAFRFKGFMVQCLNEMPRIRDKSDSFYRRQLFVPFEKCFTGAERKYIKNDYLHRQDVLEYVLKRVLHMDYYELSEPEACILALNEYKEYNDPIRQFCDEILPECAWDLLPFSFLYDLYKAWFAKNTPNGTIQGRNNFITELISLIKEYPEWACPGRREKIWTGDKMDKPEPLILEYDLQDWMNPNYKNHQNQLLRCTPTNLKDIYRGLFRNDCNSASTEDAPED